MIEEEEGGLEDEGTPAWMATFADMMSLLLTFFVLILSFANMDVIKFSAAVESLKEAFGQGIAIKELDGSLVAAPIELSAPALTRLIALDEAGESARETLRQEIEQRIAQADLSNLVEVDETEGGGVVVRVKGQLLFDPGSVELRPESYVVLAEIARLIRAVTDRVSIDGHSDDSPTRDGGFSNWNLSTGRAISVLRHFTDVEQIDRSRMSVAGFADTRPLYSNDRPEDREKNRRVEFVFQRTRN